MKKRILTIVVFVLCLTLVFALAACGDDKKPNGDNKNPGGGGGSSGGRGSAGEYTGRCFGTNKDLAVRAGAEVGGNLSAEQLEHSVSGNVKTVSGATQEDVAAYMSSFSSSNGWTAVGTTTSTLGIFYKGDTMSTVTYAGGTLLVVTVKYTDGYVQSLLGGGSGGSGGGGGGGGQTAEWFTATELTSLKLPGLAVPAGLTVTEKTITPVDNKILAQVEFQTAVTEAQFNAYCEILFNAGLNKESNLTTVRTSYSSGDSSYYSVTANAYSATMYGVGENYKLQCIWSYAKYSEDVPGKATLVINFTDTTPVPVPEWLSATQLTELGMSDFTKPADAVTEVCKQVMRYGNMVMYNVTLSGVTDVQVKALMQYFYNKGATYDMDGTSFPAYDNVALLSDWSELDETGYTFEAYWCEDCNVNIDFCSTADYNNTYFDVNKENVVRIEIKYYTNHSTGHPAFPAE